MVMATVQEPLWLTIDEVAELLGRHPSTVRKLASRGELPGVLPKVGGQWRINRKTFFEYLDLPGAPVPGA